MNNFQQPGKVVSYTAGANITSGSVVKMLNTVGVACEDIANGSAGNVAIEGVFNNVPKVTGRAWVVGEKLFWDVSTSKFDTMAGTTATGDVTGCAIVYEAAASGDATGVIKLTPGNTTIT
jgi:predicted RecA/RadA family phage recombinase